jgi:hypothetical protein
MEMFSTDTFGEVGMTYGEEVWRAGQRERHQDGVTHTPKNDGDEETDGISGHGRRQEHES